MLLFVASHFASLSDVPSLISVSWWNHRLKMGPKAPESGIYPLLASLKIVDGSLQARQT
jgi:hypothetical protein